MSVMMTRIPVSVVIITKNEASRIEECLKSVYGWVDEIILLDDDSTDNTLEIAKAYTDKFFTRTMDFEGRHRNYAYDKASCAWILSLDADERISPELKSELLNLFAAEPPCNGYAIPRKNHVGRYWAKHGGMYPSAQLRLFRKKEFRYDELSEVHPQAYMKDPRGTLKGDIIHYTYRDFADIITKLDKHTDLEARKWFRENRKEGTFSIIRKTIDRFYRSYIKKHGHKDGVVGLFLAVNSGFYQLLTYIKVLQMRGAFKLQSTPSFASNLKDESRRQTLSIVMLTKNYEHKIEDALKSASWADEIVIYDGQSTDKTIDICKKYTDKIFVAPFSGSFSTERNRATEHATMDWCLHIDPDERITQDFKDKLLKKLCTNIRENAFEFRKRNYFLGHFMRHGGWYHWSLHLFRRGKAKYKGDIHENLQVEGEIAKFEADVVHFPFESISELINRHNRYSLMEAKEELKNHKRLDASELEYQLKKKPLKRFFKFYVKKGAALDGFHGLVFSAIFAWVHFVNWAKYWELCQENHPSN